MTVPKKAITTKDAMKVFGVSHMALFLWRAGTATKTPLPVVQEEGSRNVFYMPGVIKSWAKANDVAILVDPNSFVGLERPKPGPKIKTAAKKAKVVVKQVGTVATREPKKATVKAARKRKPATH